MTKRLKEQEWLVYRMQYNHCCICCKHLLKNTCPKGIDYPRVMGFSKRYPLWRIGSACECWC